MLYFVVFCKIVIYDDFQILDDAEIGLEDDGYIGVVCYVYKFQNVKEEVIDFSGDARMKKM